MVKSKGQKIQVVELELNNLQAEVLIQALRHPNLREVVSAVKENLNTTEGIEEALEYMENEVSDQIVWGQF